MMKTIIEESNRVYRTTWEKIKSWGWANIITNLATIATLIYTVYYNQKKDEDDDIELKRIRRRDNTQIDYLIKSFNNQTAQLAWNRIQDSIQLAKYNDQLALLNESVRAQLNGLSIQNKSFVIEKKEKESDLSINFSFEPYNSPSNNKLVYLTPIAYIENVGNTTAYNVEIELLFVSIDNWTKKAINCFVTNRNSIYNLTIHNDSTKIIRYLPQLPVLTNEDTARYRERSRKMLLFQNERNSEVQKINIGNPNRQKEIERIDKDFYAKMQDAFVLYPNEFYRNFVIAKLSYKDKYNEERKIDYQAYHIHTRWPRYRAFQTPVKSTRLITNLEVVLKNDLLTMKTCIINNEFDYNYLLKSVFRR